MPRFFSAVLTLSLALNSVPAYALRVQASQESTGVKLLRSGLEEPFQPNEEELRIYISQHPSSKIVFLQEAEFRVHHKNLKDAAGKKAELMTWIEGARCQVFVVPDQMVGEEGVWNNSGVSDLYFGEEAFREADQLFIQAAILDGDMRHVWDWAAEHQRQAAERAAVAAKRLATTTPSLAAASHASGVAEEKAKPIRIETAGPTSTMFLKQILQAAGQSSTGDVGHLLLDEQGRPSHFFVVTRVEDWKGTQGHLVELNSSITGFPNLFDLLEYDTAWAVQTELRTGSQASLGTVTREGAIRIWHIVSVGGQPVWELLKQRAEPLNERYERVLGHIRGVVLQPIEEVRDPKRMLQVKTGRHAVKRGGSLVLVEGSGNPEAKELVAWLNQRAKELPVICERAIRNGLPQQDADRLVPLMRERFETDFERLARLREPREIFEQLPVLTRRVLDWVSEALASSVALDPSLFTRLEIRGLTEPALPELVVSSAPAAPSAEQQDRDWEGEAREILRHCAGRAIATQRWAIETEAPEFTQDWLPAAVGLLRTKGEIRQIDFNKAWQQWKRRSPAERGKAVIQRLRGMPADEPEDVRKALQAIADAMPRLTAEFTSEAKNLRTALTEDFAALTLLNVETSAGSSETLTAETASPLLAQLQAALDVVQAFPDAAGMLTTRQEEIRRMVAHAGQPARQQAVQSPVGAQQTAAALVAGDFQAVLQKERHILEFLKAVEESGAAPSDLIEKANRRVSNYRPGTDAVRNRFFRSVSEVIRLVSDAGLEEAVQAERVVKVHSNKATAVILAPDGTLISAGVDERIFKQDAVGGPPEPLSRKPDGNPAAIGQVIAAALSPDENILAFGLKAGTIRVSSASDGKQIWHAFTSSLRGKGAQGEGHADDPLKLAFSSDGNLLFSIGKDGRLKVWRVSDGHQEGDIALSQRSFVHADLRAEDGLTEAVAIDDQGALRAWMASADGSEQFGERLTVKNATALALHPEQDIVAVSLQDGGVHLFDLTTGMKTAEVKGHTRPVRAVAFSPSGAMLASGDESGAVFLSQTESGLPLCSLAGVPGIITALSFSKDRLAASNTQGSTALWQIPPSIQEKAEITPEPAPPRDEATEEQVVGYLLEHPTALIRELVQSEWRFHESRFRFLLQENLHPAGRAATEEIIVLMRRYPGEVRVLPLDVLGRGVQFNPQTGEINLAKELLERVGLSDLAKALAHAELREPSAFKQLLAWSDGESSGREAGEEQVEEEPVTSGSQTEQPEVRTEKNNRSGRTRHRVPRPPRARKRVARQPPLLEDASAPSGEGEPVAETAEIPAPVAHESDLPGVRFPPSEVAGTLAGLAAQIVQAVPMLPNQIVYDGDKKIVVDTTDAGNGLFATIQMPLPAGKTENYPIGPHFVMVVPTPGSLNEARPLPKRYGAIAPWFEIADLVVKMNPRMSAVLEESAQQERTATEALETLATIRAAIENLDVEGNNPASRIEKLKQGHPSRVVEIERAVWDIRKTVVREIAFACKARQSVTRMASNAQEGKLPREHFDAECVVLAQMAARRWPRVEIALRLAMQSVKEKTEVQVSDAVQIFSQALLLLREAESLCLERKYPASILQAVFYDAIRVSLIKQISTLQPVLGSPAQKAVPAYAAIRLHELLFKTLSVEIGSALTFNILETVHAATLRDITTDFPYAGIAVGFSDREGSVRLIQGGWAVSAYPNFWSNYNPVMLSRAIAPDDRRVIFFYASYSGVPHPDQTLRFMQDLYYFQPLLPAGVEVLMGTVTPEGAMRFFRPAMRGNDKEEWQRLLALGSGIRDESERFEVRLRKRTSRDLPKGTTFRGKTVYPNSQNYVYALYIRIASVLNRLGNLNEGTIPAALAGVNPEVAAAALAEIQSRLGRKLAEFAAVRTSTSENLRRLEQADKELAGVVNQVAGIVEEQMMAPYVAQGEMLLSVDLPEFKKEAAAEADSTVEEVRRLVERAVTAQRWDHASVQVFVEEWRKDAEIAPRLKQRGGVKQAEFNKAFLAAGKAARRAQEDAEREAAQAVQAAEKERQLRRTQAAQRLEQEITRSRTADVTDPVAVQTVLESSASLLADLEGLPGVETLQRQRQALARSFVERAVSDTEILYQAALAKLKSAGLEEGYSRLEVRVKTASDLLGAFPMLADLKSALESSQAKLRAIAVLQRISGLAGRIPTEITLEDVEQAGEAAREAKELIPLLPQGNDAGILQLQIVELLTSCAQAVMERYDVAMESEELGALRDFLPLMQAMERDVGPYMGPADHAYVQRNLLILLQWIEQRAREQAQDKIETGRGRGLQKQTPVLLPWNNKIVCEHAASGRLVEVSFNGLVENPGPGIKVVTLHLRTSRGFVPLIGNQLSRFEEKKGGWRNYRDLSKLLEEHKITEGDPHAALRLEAKPRSGPGKFRIENAIWIFATEDIEWVLDERNNLQVVRDPGPDQTAFQDLIYSDLRIEVIKTSERGDAVTLLVVDPLGLFKAPRVESLKPAAGLEETIHWSNFLDPETQRITADRLIAQGVEGLPILAEACAVNLGPSAQAEIRRALNEIVLHHGEQAVRSLLQRLGDRTGWRRPRGAALALAQLDPGFPASRETVAALRRLLHPRVLQAREEALTPRGYVDLMAEHLTWGGHVFTAVAQALAVHDPQRVERAISAYGRLSRRYLGSPAGEVGNDLIQKIRSQLSSAGLEEGEAGARARLVAYAQTVPLSEWDPKRMEWHCFHGHPPHRETAAWFLSRMEERALDSVRRLLSANRWQARQAGSWALAWSVQWRVRAGYREVPIDIRIRKRLVTLRDQDPKREVRSAAGWALDMIREAWRDGQRSGLEEPAFADRIEDSVAELEQNVVIFLDAGLFDAATASALADPADPRLTGLGLEMKDILPWPGSRIDLQIALASDENREALSRLYEGWRIIEVEREERTDPRPLPVSAVPQVVAEAIASGEKLFEVDVTPYLDVQGLTLQEALDQLEHLLSA